MQARRFCAVRARGGWQTRCPFCPVRLRCQCRTRGKLRILVRTVEHGAPAVQCARGAGSRVPLHIGCEGRAVIARSAAPLRVWLAKATHARDEWPHPSRDRGAFTYWMCGEGGQRAVRCATTRVVSQGNTCARRMAAYKPGQGSAVRLPCNVPAEQGAGELLHIGCAGRAVSARSAAPQRVW